jgi:glucans biosynthesis protein
MRGRTVCYHHGGRAGAPRGSRNGAYKHGHFTSEAVEARKELAALLKVTREVLEGIE